MQEDPGERLSDSEEEDKTKNEDDSMIDVAFTCFDRRATFLRYMYC